jgi:hypothetical protein
MTIDQAGQAVSADAAAPLLRTLGDADAAVCADGYCEVPPGPRAAQGPTATTGADEWTTGADA